MLIRTKSAIIANLDQMILLKSRAFDKNIWDTFYPNGPKLDQTSRAVSAQSFNQEKFYLIKDSEDQALTVEIVRQSDTNHDGKISFEEFVPWSVLLYFLKDPSVLMWKGQVPRNSTEVLEDATSQGTATSLLNPRSRHLVGISFRS